VRERVPLVPGQEPRWISFNDSNVELYDPKQIPADCYGGLSDQVGCWIVTIGFILMFASSLASACKVRVDPKTNQQLPPEEKMWSAYMLFYERIGVKHDPSYALTMQQNVPRAVLEEVWSGNSKFAADRAVFSEDYFAFLWGLVRSHLGAEPVGDVRVTQFDPVLQAIMLGTNFLFETLAHAKQKFHFQQWVTELIEMYQKHVPACRWFLGRLTRDRTWLASVFLQCTQKSTRELLADLVVAVMRTVSALPGEARDYLDANDTAGQVSWCFFFASRPLLIVA
jgi:ubiquitin carboxyl-terminal hydrolase 34